MALAPATSQAASATALASPMANVAAMRMSMRWAIVSSPEATTSCHTRSAVASTYPRAERNRASASPIWNCTKWLACSECLAARGVLFSARRNGGIQHGPGNAEGDAGEAGRKKAVEGEFVERGVDLRIEDAIAMGGVALRDEAIRRS